MAKRCYSVTKKRPPSQCSSHGSLARSNPIGCFRVSGDLVRGGDAAARLAAAVGETVEKPDGDARADEMRNVAAEGTDLLDKPRRDELKAVRGHQKDGLDLGVEPGVHAGHLELVFEIRDRAQPAEDHVRPNRLGEVDQEGVEGAHLDALGVAVLEMGDLVADDLDPLVGCEQRALPVVAGDADDQPVDNPDRPPDDIRVPVGDRVESTGVDADARQGHVSPSLACWSSVGVSEPFASPFSSATSGSRATETTRSPSPTLKITTPWLRRRAMRMSWTGQRITIPPSVTSMTWSLCPTGKTATTASLRRLHTMLSMPCPPRPVIR